MTALEREGFELRAGVLSGAEVGALLAALPPPSRTLLDSPVVQAVARRLAPQGFFAVRALLFDKTAESNWGLGWHQDLAIAVRERRDVDGFGPWTVKGGVVHALAPASLLERMVSLRVHLDDCGADNGPLRVKVGSHLHGRIPEGAVSSWEGTEQVCTAKRGDVLAFKPLLLHASASSAGKGHRRVLQLELARDALPRELEWRWMV